MRKGLILSSLLLIALVAVPTRANLSAKQARNLITKLAGMSLPSGSVRVQKPVMISPTQAEATAEVDVVFRIARNSSGQWKLSELRVGQDRWEELPVVARAIGVELPGGDCDSDERFGRADDLSVKRARCLVASLLGITLPSDAVRIKSLSGLGVPLTTEQSVIAVALVRLEFGFDKDVTGWRVKTIKTGETDFSRVETISAAVMGLKLSRARADMQVLATALDRFRQERGTFVVSDKHPALIDNLSPRYLDRVIRLDPWHNPYQYEGERDRFTLRSAGPDGKFKTADDVVLSNR